MENYQPNSRRYREEQKESVAEKKKVEKVVNGYARLKKKSELRKFTDVFISEDAASVKEFLWTDHIVPGIKKLIVSAIKITAETVFGETGVDDRRSSSSRVPYVSYNKYSDRRDDRGYERRDQSRGGFDYNEIYLDSKGEAVEVLDHMYRLIEDYGSATIGDLYDLVGITDHNYMNQKYGWTKTNFRNADSVRMRDGSYRLKLPRAVALD